MPVGCSAVVISQGTCMVSAGHCAAEDLVIQFNVPASNPDCSPNHPPIEDQFPVTVLDFSNKGPGDDWSFLSCGPNNLDQLPFHRYGEHREIAPDPAPAGAIVSLTGYGTSCACTLSLTQQTAEGTICEVLPEMSAYTFAADFNQGADGAALLVDGKVIGVATHCPCCNVAKMAQNPAFAWNLHLVCFEPCPWDIDLDRFISVTDLLLLLETWGQIGVPADYDGGGVGVTDLLTLLAHWGPCY